MNKIFKSGVFWTLLISLIISLVIIFVFPYYFESYKKLNFRLLVGLSFLFTSIILCLLYILLLQEKTKKILKERKEKRNERLKTTYEINKKIDDIKARFKEALKILKKSTLYKNNKRARYELPWYLVVGREKEGKTTLLESSGLDFPININYEDRSVKDESTTENFYWYYAEHAIFIDMPGKYVHQNSSDQDPIVWKKGFLDIFAKKRARRPINGILLNVSVETFINKNEKELEEYGKSLRDRFDELSEGFVSSIPIYLIITKSDNIVGYNDYFSSLSDDDKEEILGITFDDPSQSVDAGVVRPELEKLLKRINSSVIDKLHHEWDEAARIKILVFCDEFGKIFEKIEIFTDVCFAQTRYRKPLMIRGIYFTSVPEEKEIETSYMMGKENNNKLSLGRSSKGFFIKKLLRDVVFPESELINMDLNHKKMNQKRQALSVLFAIFVVTLFSYIWVSDYTKSNNLYYDIEANYLSAEKFKKNIKNEDDFEVVSIALDKVVKIKNKYENGVSGDFYRLGFYGVDQKTTDFYNYYHKALVKFLLPRIENFLNHQILLNLDDYTRTWSNTEVYLMLNDEKHRRIKSLETTMANAWAKIYPNKPHVQNSLNNHWKNLLALGFKPLDLKEITLKTARNSLVKEGHLALMYNALIERVDETMDLKPFSFSQVLGTNGNALINNTKKIPGLYTKKGFENVIATRGLELTREVLMNNWVLGSDIKLTDGKINKLYSQILGNYFRDYKKYWLEALNVLEIPEKLTPADLTDQMEVLTSGNSPILEVLRALKENTDIYTPFEKTLKSSNSKFKELSEIAQKNAMEKAKKTMPNSSNIKSMRNFFKDYNLLITDEGAPNPDMEATLSNLDEIFKEMVTLFSEVNPAETSYEILSNRMIGKRKAIVKTHTGLPINVERWYKKILDNNWNFVIEKAKSFIALKYQEDIMSYYNANLKNKYPLNRRDFIGETSIESFVNFFKVNGIFDSFITKYIKPFVKFNSNYSHYTFKSVDGVLISVSPDFLENVLSSYKIRKRLFSANGDKLKADLIVEMKHLEASLSTVEIKYNDNYITYEHGPTKSSRIIWPENKTDQVTTYTLYDIEQNKVVKDETNGEWSLFKMFDKFEIVSSSKNSIELKYKRSFKDKDYSSSVTLKGKTFEYFSHDLSFNLSGNL